MSSRTTQWRNINKALINLVTDTENKLPTTDIENNINELQLDESSEGANFYDSPSDTNSGSDSSSDSDSNYDIDNLLNDTDEGELVSELLGKN